MKLSRQLTGMKGFSVAWFGQVVSVLGSAMTSFGMTLWMYSQTESVTAMGGMEVVYITPFLLLSPIAGALVDRYNRKHMMMVSDLGAVFSTIIILVIYLSGGLEFWHLYIAAFFNGVGSAFQKPAYAAVISTMLPKEKYSRANGMMSLLRSGPDIVAPALAGTILAISWPGKVDGFSLILIIDIITFGLAILSLVWVNIPQPEVSEEGKQASGTLLKEASVGVKYIFSHSGLFRLMILYFIGNTFVTTGYVVYAPMVLSVTNQDSILFGTVQTFRAVGGILGSLLMSVWAGFNRKINGVLIGWISLGVSIALFGIGGSLPFWAISMAIFSLSVALTGVSGQSIWQKRVPHDLQGRVFAARTLIAWLPRPLGPLLGGALADKLLEPAMSTANGFSHFFGTVFGVGMGAGMKVLIFLSGVGVILVGSAGYLVPAIRNVEKVVEEGG